MQFPPALSFIDGRLAAPLVDDPDRGTHLASGIIPAVWPVPLADIFAFRIFWVARKVE